MIFDALQLAPAWLSVALASGTDKADATYYRSICIEKYSNGVRLVATDTRFLLHSWVPTFHDTFDPAPELDEVPDSIAVAIDVDGRAKGFLGYALKLASAKDALPIPIKLDLGIQMVSEDSTPMLAGMEPSWAVLEMADLEKVQLQLYEGDYPEWRKILFGFERQPAEMIALNPEIVGRLAKLERWHSMARLGWIFGGENKMAQLEVLDSDPFIQGVVMPCRWDLDANAPYVDDDGDDE